MSFRSAGLERMAGAVLAMAIFALLTERSRAEISFVDQYRNDSYTQSGNGNWLTYDGSYLTTNLYSTTANAYTGVQLTYPGAGSPVALTNSTAAPTVYGFSTNFYASRAAMNADFPAGSYIFPPRS